MECLVPLLSSVLALSPPFGIFLSQLLSSKDSLLIDSRCMDGFEEDLLLQCAKFARKDEQQKKESAILWGIIMFSIEWF